MQASARSNKPHGYKALIIHAWGTETLARKFAVSEDGRDTVQVRAGKNFPTRAEAIAYADREIARRVQERAKANAAYEARRAPRLAAE